MNRDEIIRMAREASLPSCLATHPVALERFAALVAAAAKAEENEACAKVCDLVAREIDDTNGTATYIAAAIRARSKT